MKKFNTDQWLKEAENLTILECYYKLAQDFPNKPAIYHFVDDKPEMLTYPQFINAINNCAKLLHAHGIKSRDKVVIMAENSSPWFFMYLAVMLCEGTNVPIDPQFSAHNTNRVIEQTNPTIFIHDGLSPEISIPEGTGVFELPKYDTHMTQKTDWLPVPKREGYTQSIIFTSGTTGEPKGVVLTDHNILTNVKDIMKTGLICSGGPATSFLPYFHVYSLTTSLMTLFGGIPNCVGSLNPDDIRKLLNTFNPYYIIAVPRLLRIVADGIRRKLADSGFIASRLLKILDRSIRNEKENKLNLAKYFLLPIKKNFGNKLHYVVSGGAKLDEEVYYMFKALGFSVHEGYGLTETSPILCLNGAEMQKPGKVGTKLKSIDLMLANEKDGLGEIAVKGGNVFSGYLGREDLTAKVIKDGWFYTGDLGRVDEDGFISIEGRANEMIVTEGGKNIFPEEIEHKFNSSDYIIESCLFLNKIPGKAPVLSVVVVPDFKALLKDSIHDITRQMKWEITEASKQLPSYQRPAEVFVHKHELPKTRLVKLRRHKIPALIVQDAQNEAVETPSAPMTKVQELVAKYVEKKYVAPESHLEIDLRLDSLARMDLHSYLEEKLGVTISQEIASRAQTVAEVDEIFSNPENSTTTESMAHKVPKLNFFKIIVQIIGDFLLSIYLKSKLNIKIKVNHNLPKDKPFIVAPNHVSLLDALVMRLCIPAKQRHKLVFLSIGKYFDKFPLNLIAWGCRLVIIGKKNTPAEAFQILVEAAKQGNPIIIFPEGSRSPDGSVQAPRNGAFRVSASTGVTTYPVAIKNLYGFHSRGGEPHNREITVDFLEPLPIAEYTSQEAITEAEHKLAGIWLEKLQRELDK